MTLPLEDLDKWIQEHPMILSNMMRAQVVASHLLIMEEIRALQGKPFDSEAEVLKLSDAQKYLSALFDIEYERQLAQQLRERRSDLHPKEDVRKTP